MCMCVCMAGVRDYIHVMDLASGHVSALTKLDQEHLRFKVRLILLLSAWMALQVDYQYSGSISFLTWISECSFKFPESVHYCFLEALFMFVLMALYPELAVCSCWIIDSQPVYNNLCLLCIGFINLECVEQWHLWRNFFCKFVSKVQYNPINNHRY